MKYRKFMFIQGPHVADPAYQIPVYELFPDDYHIAYGNTWRTRWVIKIINWLLPELSEEEIRRNKEIQDYIKQWDKEHGR